MDFSSFGLDLTKVTSCERFITQQLEPFGLTPGADLTLRLALEAGKDAEGKTILRPWARMAAILDRAINTTHVNEGEGGKLRDADKTITAWRSEQASIDAALELTVASMTSTGRLAKGSFSVKTVTDWS